MCPPRILNCPKRAREEKAKLFQAKKIQQIQTEQKVVVYNGIVYEKIDENRGSNQASD
jgi:hypothetical protein